MTGRLPLWLGPTLSLIAGVALGGVGQPAGWAIAASVLLLLVLGRWGRLAITLVATLIAVLVLVLTIAGGRDSVTLVAAAVAALGGLITARTVGRWSRRSSRYEQRATVVDADASAQDVWKAMDAGHDPTAP